MRLPRVGRHRIKHIGFAVQSRLRKWISRLVQRPPRLHQDEPCRSTGLSSPAAWAGALIRSDRWYILGRSFHRRRSAIDHGPVARAMPYKLDRKSRSCFHACRSIVLCAIVFLILLGLAAPSRLAAQGVDYIKAHYTKYEYRIPMRDGVRLFTSVYVPKDTSQRYPILLSRTPYSVQPYGVDAYKSDLGPSAHSSATTATSWSTRTSAAGGCRRASSSTCGRTGRTRPVLPTSTRAPTRLTRSTG